MKYIKSLVVIAISSAFLFSCGEKKEEEKAKEETKKEVKKEQVEKKELTAKEQGEKFQAKREEKISLDGSELFKKYHCDRCHSATGVKVGPPLVEIANAYKGKKDELIKFLKGEAPPKLAKEVGQAAHLMNLQLMATKELSDKELGALADYILSFANQNL